jgi:hypothetical protein
MEASEAIINAAPDLLSALKDLVEVLTEKWEGHPVHAKANAEWNKKLTAARAAIAKAEMLAASRISRGLIDVSDSSD